MEQNNNLQRQSQVEGMTQEELQKTQVLNLQEVEEAARYEKRTSKKPAIIAGIIGAFLLLFGGSFQVIHSYIAKQEEARMIEKRTTAVEVKTETMVCSKTTVGNGNGTDNVFTIKYVLEDGKLIEFTKSFSVTPTPGNPKGTQGIAGYLQAYKSFMNPTTGYKVSVVENDKGFVTTTEVDLEKLSMDNLNPQQQKHQSTSVDYQFNTSREQIETDMTTQGFTCK